MAKAITSLEGLPVEITVDIARHLDFASFDRLLVVSTRFRAILTGYWVGILRVIIERDFSPHDGFMHSFLGLTDQPSSSDVSKDELGLWLMGFARRAKGLGEILNYCRSVKIWEGEFQRLRFYCCPEDCRALGEHELRRLRGGLYVWRRFARCFHGQRMWGGGGGDVQQWSCVMGKLSMTQLHELNDMWETICAAVGRDLCPSVPAVRLLLDNEEAASRIGWGDTPENSLILSTIMRLSPEDILHLLVYRHRYATKASVVQLIRMRNPWIEESTETFSTAIMYATHERPKLTGTPNLPFPVPGFPGRYGGIVDHERTETEEARVAHSVWNGWEDANHRGPPGRREHALRASYGLSSIRRGRLVARSY